MCLIAPDNPANTDVGKAKLVARSVNGNNTGQLEVPEEFRLICLNKQLDPSTVRNKRTLAKGATNAPEAPSTKEWTSIPIDRHR